MILAGRWSPTRAVRAGALVDPDSGLLLDAFSDGPEPVDVELLGAVAVDIVRSAALVDYAVGGNHLLRPPRLHLEAEEGRHVVVSTATDLHGDGVVLAIVVDGDHRTARRVAQRLGTITAITLQNAQRDLQRVVRTTAPDTDRPPARPVDPPDRSPGRHRINGEVPGAIPVPRPRPYVAPTSPLPVVPPDSAGPTPYRRS